MKKKGRIFRANVAAFTGGVGSTDVCCYYLIKSMCTPIHIKAAFNDSKGRNTFNFKFNSFN